MMTEGYRKLTKELSNKKTQVADESRCEDDDVRADVGAVATD